jgi:hypothetical protein
VKQLDGAIGLTPFNEGWRLQVCRDAGFHRIEERDPG